MRFKAVILFLLIPLMGWSASLRMEGDRVWLDGEGASLIRILELFEQCGVDVLVDPSIEVGRISGTWKNAKIERVISQMASPHSYVLEWKRVQGPLGELDQLSAIRIFSAGRESAAQPLTEEGRVLDVIEGANGVKYIRGEIMIGFVDGSTTRDLKALLEKLGGTLVEIIDPPGIYRIRINEDMTVEEAMAIAAAMESVKQAEPNLAFSGGSNPSVPISGSRAGMNLDLAVGETPVAVFDSGLDPQYADLPYIRGTYNALDPGADMTDPTGHGTLVSLIASGSITPLGAASTAEVGVPVMVVRVFDDNGMTSSDVMMRAIDMTIGSGVSIINMSFGTYEDLGFLDYAVQYAAGQGTQIYVASGNDGLSEAVNPAANPLTISVGATNPDGSVADYSNTQADVFLPGSVSYDGSVHIGTSFASPYAAYLQAISTSSTGN